MRNRVTFIVFSVVFESLKYAAVVAMMDLVYNGLSDLVFSPQRAEMLQFVESNTIISMIVAFVYVLWKKKLKITAEDMFAVMTGPLLALLAALDFLVWVQNQPNWKVGLVVPLVILALIVFWKPLDWWINRYRYFRYSYRVSRAKRNRPIDQRGNKRN